MYLQISGGKVLSLFPFKFRNVRLLKFTEKKIAQSHAFFDIHYITNDKLGVLHELS